MTTRDATARRDGTAICLHVQKCLSASIVSHTGCDGSLRAGRGLLWPNGDEDDPDKPDEVGAPDVSKADRVRLVREEIRDQ